MAKDPIERLKQKVLVEGKAAESELRVVDEVVRKEVSDAVALAREAPYPDVAEVREHVYA